MHLDSGSQNVDHNGAGTAREDDVGSAFCGFDELLVHGFHESLVVTQHVFPGASTLCNVAADDTNQALVAIGINKHLDVHALAQLLVDQHHDAFHDDDLGRMHIDNLLRAGAGHIGVDGHWDGLTFLETIKMVDEQVPLDGIGVVEVDLLLLLGRLVAVVVVISILRND